MKSIRNLTLTALPLIAMLAACDKDPVIPNEDELITTLVYTLTPVGGGDPVVFSFRDPDGDGGQDPVVTTAPLQSGVTYHGAISLMDESRTPAEVITPEILEEAVDHQFFYKMTGIDPVILLSSISYADMDDDGFPVGLNTVFAVFPGDPATGTLQITLRHLPDKGAAGVSDGDIQNAGGETDIEVSFPLAIQ